MKETLFLKFLIYFQKFKFVCPTKSIFYVGNPINYRPYVKILL